MTSRRILPISRERHVWRKAGLDKSDPDIKKASEERKKKYGEIFTPPELVNEMLDHIPVACWTNPTKTVLDPACGHGNFLVEVLRRKLAHGSTPLQALTTTYGIELLPDTAEWCRERLLEIVVDQDPNQEARYKAILEKQIIVGDALDDATYERFVEWDEDGYEVPK